MNAIPDKFAQWDAAYVLRRAVSCRAREFEEHLASCLTCQSAVSELTAHPGSAGSGLASGCGDAVLVDDAPGNTAIRLIAQRIAHAGFKRSGHKRTWHNHWRDPNMPKGA